MLASAVLVHRALRLMRWVPNQVKRRLKLVLAQGPKQVVVVNAQVAGIGQTVVEHQGVPVGRAADPAVDRA